MQRKGWRSCAVVLSGVLLSPFAQGAEGGATAPSAAPALQQWTRQIVEQHPRAQAARAAVEAAEADRRAADQPLHNPQLVFEVERAAETAATVGVTQTLDWSDKRGARGELGAQEYAAALADLDGARQSLALELLQALARYRAAKAVAALEEKRVSVLQQFSDVAAVRFQAGDIGRADADLARLSLAEARLRRANVQAGLLDAEQALRTAGAATTQAPMFAPDVPAIDDSAGQQREQWLAQHPELRALQARWRAAQVKVRLAERERRDDPTLGVRGGKDGGDALIGLTFTLPLSVRNPRRAEVAAANARAIGAEQETHVAMQRLRARLDAALVRHRVFADAYAQWRAEGQALLADRAALLNRLWRAGELSTTDYLVQLRETLDGEAEAAELFGKMWSAWFSWIDAAGLLNAWLNPEIDNKFTATK